MMLVEWLTFDGAETIEMPRFSLSITGSLQSAGQRTKRKRDARSEKKDVRNLSENDADKSDSEEKRREEVKHRGLRLCPRRLAALHAGRPGGGRRAESICALSCRSDRRSVPPAHA